MTKKQENMSQNQNDWWVTLKIFLSAGSRDIYNDNLIRPHLNIARSKVRGSKKGLKGLKMNKKQENMSQNQNYWWDTFKIFLSTSSRDIFNNNLVTGAQKRPAWAQNLVLEHIYLVFGHFESIQALSEPPDSGQGYAQLGAGSNCHCI